MDLKSNVWGCALVAALLAIPAGAAPFQVTLEADAVVASGVTPGGTVVLLGVTREIEEDDFPVVRRHLEILSDKDGDGTVRYNVGSSVPPRSLWAAADLSTGSHGVVTPEELGVRLVDWRGRGLERGFDGKDVVEDQRTLLEILVVRPQAGVWMLRVSDGDESDGDGTINGRLESVLDQLKPLNDSPPPPYIFEKGDLVMALDPAALEVTLVTLQDRLEK